MDKWGYRVQAVEVSEYLVHPVLESPCLIRTFKKEQFKTLIPLYTIIQACEIHLKKE